MDVKFDDEIVTSFKCDDVDLDVSFPWVQLPGPTRQSIPWRGLFIYPSE